MHVYLPFTASLLLVVEAAVAHIAPNISSAAILSHVRHVFWSSVTTRLVQVTWLVKLYMQGSKRMPRPVRPLRRWRVSPWDWRDLMNRLIARIMQSSSVNAFVGPTKPIRWRRSSSQNRVNRLVPAFINMPARMCGQNFNVFLCCDC